MTEDMFNKILQNINLPIGVLLKDGTTYRVTKRYFKQIDPIFSDELKDFEKFLVLSDGQNNVVGGILFYGNVDIQATTFPEYRGKHFMSSIHKNGILRKECYRDQRVTIDKYKLTGFDDFQMKSYLLHLAGLKPDNIKEIYRYLHMLHYHGIESYTEEDFIREFG